ncbi:glycoside hydrolase family 25 protein [Erythrobacter rubeus]|uniref:Glycoside hydrolase family 25 protein n=1 Tax=Erythrobacter rubeus TaxID=2760803 RepID=A0ABR8KN88_9SPHN|nr:glycoside hydrolase family 25 protein [Erythrobacter rubeus]MBD2840665.1 glycoside hydrolase family 25 protein [Erythrobacter rubeus]
MAKSRRASSSRRKKAGAGRWLLRLVALVALFGMVFAGWFWWDMRDWKPDEAAYPEQGAVIASGASGTRFETLKALGGDFVYLELAPVGGAPDPGFAARLKSAQASGLKVGVIYPFDPCRRADPQSARFTRMVPRSGELLPPAVALRNVADGCDASVSDAAVESELLTLVNQIEMHAGKPAVLKLSPTFQSRYNAARTFSRDLWLARDRARPDYAGRPWLLWSANSQLVSAASPDPIEWVVVQR